MTATFDPPKDGRDDEESGIPALYTYLGQFIDHDITFDPASSLQKQNDPDALVDFRTPASIWTMFTDAGRMINLTCTTAGIRFYSAIRFEVAAISVRGTCRATTPTRGAR